LIHKIIEHLQLQQKAGIVFQISEFSIINILKNQILGISKKALKNHRISLYLAPLM